jgi:hypothetical protein
MDKKLVDMPLHKRVPINTLDGLHGMRESTLNHMTQWLQTAVQAEYPLCRGCGHAKINSAILQNIHDMSVMVHGTVKCEHTFCAKERQEMAIIKMNGDMWDQPWTTSAAGDMKSTLGLPSLSSMKEAMEKLDVKTLTGTPLDPAPFKDILQEPASRRRRDKDKPQTDVDAW